MAQSDNFGSLAPADVEPAVALQETLRQAVEKGLAESRAAYTRVKEAADEATSALEASVTNTSKGVIDFNTKALDALRANFDAGIDFAKAAINSKSVGELVALQGDHANKRAEAFAAQAKEFGDLAQKIAVDAVTPIQTQIAKTFRRSA
jgi:phasin